MQCCYCCVALGVGVGAAELCKVQGHQAPRACHPAADLSKFSSACICDVRSFAASDAGRCVRNACSSCSSSPWCAAWQATRTKAGLKRVPGSEKASTSHFLCPSLLSSTCVKAPRSTGMHIPCLTLRWRRRSASSIDDGGLRAWEDELSFEPATISKSHAELQSPSAANLM